MAASAAAGNDFLRTFLISSTQAASDGAQIAVVTIQLINTNGSVVVGVTPNFTVSPSLGVTALGCTASDANGFVSCSLKSISPGLKVVTLTGLPIRLTGSVTFTDAIEPAKAFASAGGFSGSATGGYTLKLTAGGVMHGFHASTNDGYRIKFFAPSDP